MDKVELKLPSFSETPILMYDVVSSLMFTTSITNYHYAQMAAALRMCVEMVKEEALDDSFAPFDMFT